MSLCLQGDEEIISAVKAAVRAGYRHIDCASIYRNERAVGVALKELFVLGIVKREDLFITSKVLLRYIFFCTYKAVFVFFNHSSKYEIEQRRKPPNDHSHISAIMCCNFAQSEYM